VSLITVAHSLDSSCDCFADIEPGSGPLRWRGWFAQLGQLNAMVYEHRTIAVWADGGWHDCGPFVEKVIKKDVPIGIA